MKLWIARDTKGDLFLFDHKPVEEHWPYDNVFYECEIDHCLWLGKDTYPEITFENSPQEVELKFSINQ